MSNQAYFYKLLASPGLTEKIKSIVSWEKKWTNTALSFKIIPKADGMQDYTSRLSFAGPSSKKFAEWNKNFIGLLSVFWKAMLL